MNVKVDMQKHITGRVACTQARVCDQALECDHTLVCNQILEFTSSQKNQLGLGFTRVLS